MLKPLSNKKPGQSDENTQANDVNARMIEYILKQLPLIKPTTWRFLSAVVIFWLLIFIEIEHKSTRVRVEGVWPL